MIARFKSIGTLRFFHDPKLIVEVDPEITLFARSLVPKAVRLNRQKYAPHITVVRCEPLVGAERWDGVPLEFEYETYVRNDDTYHWLRVFSDELIRIRLELGLPALSWGCRGPDHFDSFHTTIGNQK